MKHKYGYFSDGQLSNYKTKLHKDIFWLLLYKDPEKDGDFLNVNYDKYFYNLMRKINGLNSLLFYPIEIVEILSLLEAAMMETQKESFDFKVYRKLLFDVHTLIDKIGG